MDLEFRWRLRLVETECTRLECAMESVLVSPLRPVDEASLERIVSYPNRMLDTYQLSRVENEMQSDTCEGQVADLWPMRELMTSETGSLELESVSEFAMQPALPGSGKKSTQVRKQNSTSGKKLRTKKKASERPYAHATSYERLLLGDHLEDVVVLREGCARLGLSEAEALPAWLRASLEGCRTALEFLRKAEAHPEAARHTARLESTEDDGVQREVCSMGVKRRFDEAEPDSWRGLSRRCLSCAQRVAQEDDEACCSGEASSSRAAAGGRSGTLYVCELQRLRSRARGPSTTEDAARLPATRSARTRSTREAFGDLARWTLAWDDVNDGLFVGGKGAGKGLHIDQVDIYISQYTRNICTRSVYLRI